ncbi:hypothetical protein C9374_005050 [Naegleria lovaniensis]|uniref:Uncharacterized protein n=1 Tax=Naegleria lovaniensis TaxID=51637 RepID=A0AA88GQY8_NAELO|nr:uncharacterized protein C9374_005050 [Naegleria lovaniensis]KAG2382470.1 hypothetical protein C9374_005050 [Naegleria lovaniensis]
MVAKTIQQSSAHHQGLNSMLVEHGEISGSVAGCSKPSLNKTRKFKTKNQCVLQLTPLVIDKRIKLEKMAVLVSEYHSNTNQSSNEAHLRDETASNSGSLYFVEDSLKSASSSDYDDFVIV